MKESSVIMLGLVSYLTAGVILLGNLSANQPITNLVEKGPLIVHIGAPHEASVLADYLETHGLSWPIQQSEIPALLVKALPRDMAEIHSTKERKSLFLRTLLPIVLLENHKIKEQRIQLEKIIRQKSELTDEQQYWLEERLKYYRLSGDVNNPELVTQLLQRLDQLPPSLMLAQGAIESGWGTSRFAQQGNSLFGQWSYSKNSGLVPDARNEGANHVVRSFDSLQASVQAYMRNLNTHAAYQSLREIRATMRTAQQPLDSTQLSEGLIRYSQRGEPYVEDVKLIIRSNKLTQYDHIELTQVAALPKAG